MKRLLLLFALLTLHRHLFPQIYNGIPSSIGIAGTSVADRRSINIFKNPSGIAYAEQTSFAYQYENKYIINELSLNSAQALIHTDPINADLSLAYFGYSLYHELLVGVGFARNFSDKFSIGLRFVYLSAYFSQDNCYKGALLAQPGLMFRMTPKFTIGFETFNPFQTAIKTEYATKKIISLFSIGVEHDVTDEFVWRAQIDRVVGSAYRFACGFEYLILNKVNFKLGLAANDYLAGAGGIGLYLNRFHLDFNCEVHPILGISPSVGIRHNMKK
ncbi:MAG: hypothetical protein LBH80_02200 [Prevotellaceae bacterium]|jgi:hypothetical protein|nr:hypothetical protein [Prevotellaceae bacterium]